MGIFNEFFKKEKPVFTGLKFGFGSGGGGGASSSGSSNTDALIFGGSSPSATANTELFNGTSWTELNNLSTAVYANGGTGSSLDSINIGGNVGSSQVTTTEEWNAATANHTITVK